MSAAARPATPRTATGQGPQPVAGRPQIASGLVAFIVGETSRASGSKSRSRPSAKPAGQLEGKAGASAKPSSTEWKFRWSGAGPGPLLTDDGSEPDLTLTLSPGDAELVRNGQLDPSVAFMQGRLKTSGDNALLLEVLSWTTTPAFAGALAAWSTEPSDKAVPVAGEEP